MKKYFLAYTYQDNQYTTEFVVMETDNFADRLWYSVSFQRGFYNDNSVFSPPSQAKRYITINAIVEIPANNA